MEGVRVVPAHPGRRATAPPRLPPSSRPSASEPRASLRLHPARPQARRHGPGGRGRAHPGGPRSRCSKRPRAGAGGAGRPDRRRAGGRAGAPRALLRRGHHLDLPETVSHWLKRDLPSRSSEWGCRSRSRPTRAPSRASPSSAGPEVALPARPVSCGRRGEARRRRCGAPCQELAEPGGAAAVRRAREPAKPRRGQPSERNRRGRGARTGSRPSEWSGSGAQAGSRPSERDRAGSALRRVVAIPARPDRGTAEVAGSRAFAVGRLEARAGAGGHRPLGRMGAQRGPLPGMSGKGRGGARRWAPSDPRPRRPPDGPSGLRGRRRSPRAKEAECRTLGALEEAVGDPTRCAPLLRRAARA